MGELTMAIVLATMTVMGVPTDKASPSKKATQVLCGAMNIYHESRGESDIGMVAVAHVVRNRVKSRQWPNNTCDVVYQSNQFSWTNDGISNIPDLDNPINRESFIKSAWVHIVASNHDDITNGSTHYHKVGHTPYWSYGMTSTAIIKDHIFYK